MHPNTKFWYLYLSLTCCAIVLIAVTGQAASLRTNPLVFKAAHTRLVSIHGALRIRPLWPVIGQFDLEGKNFAAPDVLIYGTAELSRQVNSVCGVKCSFDVMQVYSRHDNSVKEKTPSCPEIERWQWAKVLDGNIDCHGYAVGCRNWARMEGALGVLGRIGNSYPTNSDEWSTSSSRNFRLLDHLSKLALVDVSEFYSHEEQKGVQDYLRPVNTVPPFGSWPILAGMMVALCGFCILLRHDGPASGWLAILGVACVAAGVVVALWDIGNCSVCHKESPLRNPAVTGLLVHVVSVSTIAELFSGSVAKYDAKLSSPRSIVVVDIVRFAKEHEKLGAVCYEWGICREHESERVVHWIAGVPSEDKRSCSIWGGYVSRSVLSVVRQERLPVSFARPILDVVMNSEYAIDVNLARRSLPCVFESYLHSKRYPRVLGVILGNHKIVNSEPSSFVQLGGPNAFPKRDLGIPRRFFSSLSLALGNIHEVFGLPDRFLNLVKASVSGSSATVIRGGLVPILSVKFDPLESREDRIQQQHSSYRHFKKILPPLMAGFLLCWGFYLMYRGIRNVKRVGSWYGEWLIYAGAGSWVYGWIILLRLIKKAF